MDMSMGRAVRADDHWCDLVHQIGSEAAAPLTAALERVNQLAATGRIDRLSLRALHDELVGARRVAMLGQQFARLAAGRVRQHVERVSLPQLLRQVLSQRSAHAQARGVEFRPVLSPTEVEVDASLLFALLEAVLDWALMHASSPIELRLGSSGRARMSCRFSHACAGDLAALDSLPWRLAQQIAGAMGVSMQRHDQASRTALMLTLPEAPARPDVREVNPLTAGSQILVLAARTEVRARVREALRSMELVLDFVPTIEQARAFCREGMPHVLVYESAFGGERLDALRHELLLRAPALSFIELDEDGDAFTVAGRGGAPVAHVGRETIISGLPAVLLVELSRRR